MKTQKSIFIFLLLCFNTFVHAQELIVDENGFQTFEISESDTSYLMKQYFFGLIKKGPMRGQDEAVAATLQTEHRAYMGQIANEGKLDIAGPFGGDDDNQGIVIYNVATYEEARELANNDPMVKAGRLIIEVLPLWAAKGSSLK